MITSLKFISSSADFYLLLNGVEVRLKLYSALAELLLNSYVDVDYSYIVPSFKLWTQKIIPDP